MSVVVDTGTDRVVVAGDAAMTRSEYTNRTFSHWYTDEQLPDLNASIDTLESLSPTLVLPGHDRAFSPDSEDAT